jgi:hypothetical protein
VGAEDAENRAAVDERVPQDGRVQRDRARPQLGDEAEIIVDADGGGGADG